MDYRDTMRVLSQCGLGAALPGKNETILAVNETDGHLFHGERMQFGTERGPTSAQSSGPGGRTSGCRPSASSSSAMKKLEKNVKNVSKAALERSQAYRRPGSVRELQHAIEHAMDVLPDELSTITPKYIPEHILSEDNGPALRPVPEHRTASLNTSIRDAAYQIVCRALRESGGNISEASRTLEMNRQNLEYRIKRYQINIDELLKG